MKTTISQGVSTEKLILPEGKRDHIQGPIDAPMTLVEYGDFECPSCGQAHLVIQAIQQTLDDRLCFAFRHFPLTNMHPHAEPAAEAAEAAGAQGNFWGMHDLLFENQDELEYDDLGQYAAVLGLNVPKLMNEVLTGAHSARIREDFRSGVRAGVNGTPSLFINGVRYDGPQIPNLMLAALTQPAEWREEL
jgi:protein-disulfide isomerase